MAVYSPGELRSGDYVYSLVQASDNNWYLQSQFSEASTDPEAIPTLGAWASALLSSLLAGLAGLARRRARGT